jgi:hypothetical protein
MTIQWRFEPDPEALERVVEILYRLLVEPPGGSPENRDWGAEAPAKAPCLSTEHEG